MKIVSRQEDIADCEDYLFAVALTELECGSTSKTRAVWNDTARHLGRLVGKDIAETLCAKQRAAAEDFFNLTYYPLGKIIPFRRNTDE